MGKSWDNHGKMDPELQLEYLGTGPPLANHWGAINCRRATEDNTAMAEITSAS